VRVRVTRSARKHKIGVAHIRAAILNAGEAVLDDDGALSWVGLDDRGIELEIVAVPDDRHIGDWAGIHAMPTEFREGRK